MPIGIFIFFNVSTSVFVFRYWNIIYIIYGGGGGGEDVVLGGQVLKGVDMTTSLTPLIAICRTPQL